MLNTYLPMECASNAQHKVCWTHKCPVSSVVLAGLWLAAFGQIPSESHYCPLCPQARLPETKDTKGAAHRQAGPHGGEFQIRKRQPHPRDTQRWAAVGSGAWAKTQNEGAPQEVGAASFKQGREGLGSCQALGWAGRGEPPLWVPLCSLRRPQSLRGGRHSSTPLVFLDYF